ncbi:unnamed protein product, partial [Rotaria magnacalcarata]
MGFSRGKRGHGALLKPWKNDPGHFAFPSKTGNLPKDVWNP